MFSYIVLFAITPVALTYFLVVYNATYTPADNGLEIRLTFLACCKKPCRIENSADITEIAVPKISCKSVMDIEGQDCQMARWQEGTEVKSASKRLARTLQIIKIGNHYGH
jgi:hypothetical protein